MNPVIDKIIDILIAFLVPIIIFCITRAFIGWKNWPGLKYSFRIISEFSKAGGVNFFSSRKSYTKYRDHGTPSEYISKCKSSVYYIGFWLSHSTEVGSAINTFREVLESGRKVTIVLLNPDSDVILPCSQFLGLNPSELKSRINNSLDKFIELHHILSSSAKKNLTIKVHNIPISSSAFLLDSELGSGGRTLLDVKLYGFSRDDSFGIEFINQGRQLYDKVTKSFLEIEDSATTINI